MTGIFTFQSHAYSRFLILFLCMISSANLHSQPVLSLTPAITTGLSMPIQLVNAGDQTNRIFIVQKEGAIRVYDASFNFLSVFLTVSNIAIDGERGLLSMAFHPQYKTNGFFYVYYVNTGGNLELARYHVSSDANVADASTKVILITIPHPTNGNHNGGELHFGNDGFLYLSTGDGGGAGDEPNNAQNTGVLLGKILRFNVNTSNTSPYYTIPAGNPYGNEIFALGLRNPFRWSFDRSTHDMWIGDVGQNSYEEVDFRPAASTTGANYGWRCYEGNVEFNTTSNCGPAANYVFPVYTYETPNPSGAITGGVVYRGSDYPLMQGYYLSVDFFTGVFNLTVSDGGGGWLTTNQTLTPTGIADFGETENGEVYVVSLTDNSVSRLNGGPVVPVTLAEFNGTLTNDGVMLNWRSAMEQNLSHYDIEYSTTGNSFTYLAAVPAQNAGGGYTYNFLDDANRNGVIFYRLKMVDIDGSYKYSDIIRINFNNNVRNIIAPSIIHDGVIHLNLSSSLYNTAELVSMNGEVLVKENIEGRTGDIKISTGRVAKGMYAVRLSGNSATMIQKIIIQ